MRTSLTQHDAVFAAKTVEPLSCSILEAIRQFDTRTIANAIEHFRVRLRNEGFTRPGLRCVTGAAPRLVGYAATCRVRSADPSMSGNAYVDRTEARIPEVASGIRAKERGIIDLCQSPEFSLERLSTAVQAKQ